GSPVRLTQSDVGKLLAVSPGSSDLAVIMPEGALVAGGLMAVLNVTGTSKALLRPVGNETINGLTGYTLAGSGSVAILAANDDGWTVVAASPPRAGFLVVNNWTAVALPALPVPGAIYMAPAVTVAPWRSGYLYESDGASGWAEITPVPGMTIVFSDLMDTISGVSRNAARIWSGVAWVRFDAWAVALDEKLTLVGASAGLSPIASAVASAVAGAPPPVLPATIWTAVTFTAVSRDAIVDGEIVGAQLSLPAGVFEVAIKAAAADTGRVRLRLRSLTSAKVFYGLPGDFRDAVTSTLVSPAFSVTTNPGAGVVALDAVFVLTAAETFVVEMRAENAGTMGRTMSDGGDEMFASLVARKVA
ncbi:MAG: hypothetical protein ACRCU1_02440, partial [Alsobacter sp.]